MAINRTNGSITGKKNKASGGGNAVTNYGFSGTHNIQPRTTEVDVLVVAGGGGGGAQGGGGGAGGFRDLKNEPVVGGTAIAVTVGAGGVGGYFGGPVPASDITPTSGGDSVFANPINPITSTGGGRGGGRQSPGGLAAANGGSGGGGGSAGLGSGFTDAGSGTASQGNDGGAGRGSDNTGGAGGGGAGAAGTTVLPGNGDGGGSSNQGNFGQPGGIGAYTTITGFSKIFAGGGGGTGNTDSTALNVSGGHGGAGGGGQGRNGAEPNGVAGSGGEGQGGGGGSSSQPGNKASPAARSGGGGSGTVIVKEKDKANGVFNMNAQFNANKVGQWPGTGILEVSNSVRTVRADSSKLSFTPENTGSTRKLTFSFWMKRGLIDGNDQHIISSQADGSNLFALRIKSDNKLQFLNAVGGTTGNGFTYKSNSEFKDQSAWYHIVVAIDTTNSNGNGGLISYINGVRQTVYSISSYNQNTDMDINVADQVINVLTKSDSSDYFDGYIADFHMIDGQQLECGHFGERDPDSPNIWRPKKYNGTYGVGGFHLEFKNSAVGSAGAAMIGTDTSGNGHHFASTNLATTDQSTDTPTNNFATFNPLSNHQSGTLSEGSTKLVTPAGSANGMVPTTIGLKSGKWYWEVNQTSDEYTAIGIIAGNMFHKAYLTGASSSTRIVKSADGKKYSSNSDGGNYMAAFGGSILQIALNLDDGEITFGAGGSWANGSGATNQTFANSTAAYTDLNSSSDFTNQFIFPVCSDENHGTSDTMIINFGSPSFAISSGNADDNGYGNFEYDVPTGYYAICTKNLAQYG